MSVPEDPTLADLAHSLWQINWKALLYAAWDVDAALTTRIFQRFKVPANLQSDLQSLLLQAPETAQHVPELVPALVQAKAPEQALRVGPLQSMRACNPLHADI